MKQYNTGSSAWETVVVGGPGPAGLSSMTLAELNTAVTDADAEKMFPKGVRKVKPYLRYTPQPNL